MLLAPKLDWGQLMEYWQEMYKTMTFTQRHAVMDAWAAIDKHAKTCWFVLGRYSDQDRAVEAGIVFG